jgi:hypothetical protein
VPVPVSYAGSPINPLVHTNTHARSSHPNISTLSPTDLAWIFNCRSTTHVHTRPPVVIFIECDTAATCYSNDISILFLWFHSILIVVSHHHHDSRSCPSYAFLSTTGAQFK